MLILSLYYRGETINFFQMILSVFLKVQTHWKMFWTFIQRHGSVVTVMQLGPERAHQVLATDDGDKQNFVHTEWKLGT